ncbi:hypothetical protein TPA0909_37380 [Streptomyces albus]|nr:hypothetical protein TPA0909_37380 [Streptomyces albus]
MIPGELAAPPWAPASAEAAEAPPRTRAAAKAAVVTERSMVLFFQETDNLRTMHAQRCGPFLVTFRPAPARNPMG